MIKGLSYTINITTSNYDILSLWIDYDQSETFDPSEWTQISVQTQSGISSSVSFNVPNTAILGQTSIKIRSRASGNTNNASSACSTFGSGITEDYTINIATITCNPPTIVTLIQPTCTVATGSVVLGGLPSIGTWILTRTLGSITTKGSGVSTTLTGLATGTYTYFVTNVSGCISGASANVVINEQPTSPPNQPGSISGNAYPAVGTSKTYSVASVYGVTSYTWTLPIGWSGSSMSNSIIVAVGSSGGIIMVTANNSCGSSISQNLSISTGIEDSLETRNFLGQNYPNPFEQSTTIDFKLVKSGNASLTVFNSLGQVVDVIVNEFLSIGTYTKRWEPKNLSDGIYYHQLKVEGFKATRRLIIMK